MFLFLIGFGIFVFLIVIGIVFILKKASKKYLEEQIEESKKFFTKIEEYFADFDVLSREYISKNDEIIFQNKWTDLYSEIQHKHFSLKIPDREKISYFLKVFSNLHSEIETRNELFLRKEMEANNELLSNIDGKSLDYQQRTVVVSDEDRTLVLAGAGSGKTLTIAAKVKYLCQVKNVNPKDILLISFTNKSAAEMSERIQNKLGIPVVATTFHKLGLDIITSELGHRPDVYDELDGFVHNFFDNELLNHPDLVQSLTEYFTYYLEIPEDFNECSSLGELYENEKSADLETLKSKYDREKYISSISKKMRSS